MRSRFIILLAIIITFLSSCSQKDISVNDILSKMVACETNAPAGRVYFSSAKFGDEHFASESLLSALFGKEIEMAESFAFRISSFAMPYEYAIFKCSSEDTNDIAKMCHRRIESVKRLALREGEDTNISSRVYVSGGYVIMLITDSNDTLLDAAKSVMH